MLGINILQIIRKVLKLECKYQMPRMIKKLYIFPFMDFDASLRETRYIILQLLVTYKKLTLILTWNRGEGRNVIETVLNNQTANDVCK